MCAGIYGSHPEDRARERELNAYLDKDAQADKRKELIEARAVDKFYALPDFYSPKNAKYRYTNMEDAMGNIDQVTLILIARSLRDQDFEMAGQILSNALMKQCRKEAENEIDDEECEDD